jgi:hypothetical protein
MLRPDIDSSKRFPSCSPTTSPDPIVVRLVVLFHIYTGVFINPTLSLPFALWPETLQHMKNVSS